MILCICLSPALDVTYRVSRLQTGGTNRVTAVTQRPGGKAINVARILQQLGAGVQVVAPIGGGDGARFAADLDDLDIPALLVETSCGTRRTVTVFDESLGDATVFSEAASIDCWDELLRVASAEIVRADAVVVSGALPAGVPETAIATLVGRCHDLARPVLVDTSEPGLRPALAAVPTMVKPNAEELRLLTDDSDAPRAAGRVAAAFGTVVVASLGPVGVIAASPSRTWSVRPGHALSGNPTGAGDALVAGLAIGLADRRAAGGSTDLATSLDGGGTEPPRFVVDAVALSAASVLSPVAGEVDLAAYREQQRSVSIVELAGQR
ncbi:tagatose 6-phosphate kinase [Jatrophihabitans sp. GAS493]|uniref:1-phosphofructokinase family hexose kinase n=1 Tax=Jatrophihabitans sp. GAS493 TaxID=1907575 RepID=UPI000BB6CA3A|nr:PfkB family carbohydrate kinase [Jatrophihabitans sp. GAS493]SOD74872.1 tagatose 6-phosphate kinase [Jatrophihabitans sp. GAS493]